LLTSEVISFFHIYHTNIRLGSVLTALKDAGHLVVPNLHVIPSLFKIVTAMAGAVFFVLTAGVLVSALSVVSALFLLKLVKKKSTAALFYSLFWLTVTLMLNRTGVSLIMVLYTVLIPLSVFIFLKPFNPGLLQKTKSIQLFLAMVIFFTASASLFVLSADRGIFLRARDYLLLSNGPGNAVNTFYYRYTLHAAQAIKTPFQKQVIPYWINPEISRKKQLKAVLSTFGWLDTASRTGTDYIISSSEDNRLVFKHRDNAVVSISCEEFIRQPGKTLKRFSKAADNAAGLRLLCLAGLGIGLPGLIFLMLFLSIHYLLTKIVPYRPSIILAGILSTGLSVLLLFYLNPSSGDLNQKNIDEYLHSKDPRTRIEALRAVCDQKNNIWNWPDAVNLLIKGDIAEKYWLANTMAINKDPRSIPVLYSMTHDNSINVQCAAIRALAKIKRSESMGRFRHIIENSPEWYVQQCAFRALKGR